MESQYSNEQLCELIQQGQTALLFQLWRQTEAFIRSLAKSYIQQFPVEKRDLLEDCVQESYLSLPEIVAKYQKERGGFLTYLKYSLRNVFRSVMFSGRGQRAENDPLNNSFSLDAVHETEDGEVNVQLLDERSEAAFNEIDEADYRKAQNSFIRECIELSKDETSKAILLEMLDSNCTYREAIINLYGPIDEKLIIKLRRKKDNAITQIRRSNKTIALRKKYGLEQYADRSGLRRYTLSRFKSNNYTSEVERIVINHLK